MESYAVYAFTSIGHEEIRALLKRFGIFVDATEKDRGSYYMRAHALNGTVDSDKVIAECKQTPGIFGFGITPIER